MASEAGLFPLQPNRIPLEVGARTLGFPNWPAAPRGGLGERCGDGPLRVPAPHPPEPEQRVYSDTGIGGRRSRLHSASGVARSPAVGGQGAVDTDASQERVPAPSVVPVCPRNEWRRSVRAAVGPDRQTTNLG